MKPRRWYSSPEVNPQPLAHTAHPFPQRIYWVFTAVPCREQGPIIKRAIANPPQPSSGSEAAIRVVVPACA